MPYANNQKEREYKRIWNKKHYLQNTESEKKRIEQRKADMKKWFADLKGGLRCLTCGETHPACLEFHHVNKKEKATGISESVLTRGFSKERILSEINKCTVFCANCHRKQHFE